MIYKLYSIKDLVAQEHGPIYTAKNHDVARRMYANTVGQEKLKADEYELYYLGHHDTETGIITPVTPEPVGSAIAKEE